MPRPESLLPARAAVAALAGALLAGLVPGLVTGITAPAAAAHTASTATQAPAEDDAPLAVSMVTMSPSTVPRSGPVRVTGSVTNRSDETWRAINLHPFVGNAPITSSRELAEQTELDPAQYVGDRVTEVGNFDNVGDLEPGESATFSITLSNRFLPSGEPGTYWFGVHALGETDSQPRDGIADGRVRTFLPLVPRTNRVLPTALVVPVRHQVRHTAAGRVADVRRWARHLADGGALRELVDFGASAGSRPLTWLVDPAVLDAVQRLVDGNPRRSLDDTVVDDGEEPGTGGSDGPEAEPSPSEGETEGPDTDETPSNVATDPGLAWLNRFREAVSGNQVLALPWGDVDVSAAAEHDPDVITRARRRSGTSLEPFGIDTSPVIAPPNGHLDPEAIDALPTRGTVLVSEEMFGRSAPARAQIEGRRVVVTSTASRGGPAPTDPRGSVAMRQQILAEAAVRLLSPGRKPLVVVFPDDWAPTSTTGFFSGLDVEWLDLTDLDGLGQGAGGVISPDRLTYPDELAARELEAANFLAADALVDAGETLQDVLLRNDQVAATIADEALTGLSYSTRQRPVTGRILADRSRSWVTRQLGKVRVRAPRAVTLSSSRGQFSATLVNNLDHAVVVRLEAVIDAPMRITGPETIEIAARSRTSVLLDASTERLGVTNVQLLVTDLEGTPLGASDQLPIRSGQVSQVIWVIMGAGVALLFGAIVIRLVRRISRARAERRAGS